MLVGAIMLIISLISELMKFLIKKKSKVWILCGKDILFMSEFFLIFNLFFYMFNEDHFHIIPYNISGYMFWLSIGIYIGFEIAKFEMKRILEKKGKL